MAEDTQQRPDAFNGHKRVFIVRIWLEPREIAGAAVVWRGVIEHVPTHKQRYFNDLGVITSFIAPYLESMGVRRGKGQLRRRLRRWLNLWLNL